MANHITFNYIYLVQNIRNMMVNNADVQLLPKTLIIPSCNLQIGNTLGQGKEN